MKKDNNEVNLLELTPKRLYGSEERIDGCVNVLIPRFKISFFQNISLKIGRPYIKAELDEIGSYVWNRIDGVSNVKGLVSSLQKRYEGLEQTTERCCEFLRQMYKNKFIVFIELENKK